MIISRKHVVHKIYTCNDAADDLLMFGDLTMSFKNGKEVMLPFSARGVFDTSGGDGARITLWRGWFVRPFTVILMPFSGC